MSLNNKKEVEMGFLNKIIVFVIFWGFLFAQEPMHFPFQALIRETKLSEKLGLSKEQRDKIKEIVFDMEKKAENLRSQIRIKEIELKEIIMEDKPDLKKLESKIKEIGNLNTELRILKVKEFFEVKKILNEEQWEKFKEIIQERPFLKERYREKFWEKKFQKD